MSLYFRKVRNLCIKEVLLVHSLKCTVRCSFHFAFNPGVVWNRKCLPDGSHVLCLIHNILPWYCVCVKYYHFALTVCCCCCCCCCCWAMLYRCRDSSFACCKTQLALYSLGGCDVISHEQVQGDELCNKRFEDFEWGVPTTGVSKNKQLLPFILLKKDEIFKNWKWRNYVNCYYQN